MDTNEKFEERPKRVRKKAKKQVRPGIVISVVLVLLSFVILFLTPIFNIKQIIVEGNQSVKTVDIVKASGLEINKNLFASNTGEAENKIRQVPYVESVKVTRQMPDKIKITIVEGKVSAYLKWNGKFVGINENGQILCVVNKPSPSKAAPVVKGISVKAECIVGQTLVPNQTTRYETLLKFAKAFNQRGLTQSITSFDISEIDYINFMHRDKLKVEFGSDKDFEHKFSFFEALLESMGTEVEGELNMISENYTYGHTVQ